MPGPIATAFIEVVARLEAGGMEDELVKAVAQATKRATAQLKNLEKAGGDAARKIAASFDRITLDLQLRRALQQVSSLGGAVDALGTAINRIDQRGAIGLDTTRARTAFDGLNAQVAALLQSLRSVDGENIQIDFRDTERRLRTLLLRLNDVSVEVENLNLRGDTGVKIRDATFKDIDRLGKGLQQALRDVEALDGKQINVEVDQLEITNIVGRLEEAVREVDRLDGRTVDLNTAPATAAMDRLETKTRAVGNQIDLTTTNFTGFGERFKSVFERVGAYALIGGAIAAIQQLISVGIQAAAQIEIVRVSLERLFVGFAAAGQQLGGTSQDFLRNLQQIAVQTPFEFADLGDISRRLVQLDGRLGDVAISAEAIGTRSGLALERMRTLADAAASVGATGADIEGVVRAISQLQAKGRVDLQDLRQIAERLPNLSRQMEIQGMIDELNELRPTLNATTADFNELRAQGIITAQIAVDGLFRALDRIPGAEGAAAAQARTLTGALSNLRDFATIEFARAFQDVGAQLAEALNEAFSGTGGGGGLAESFEQVIDAAATATSDALPELLEFAERLTDEFSDALGAAGALAESLASGFGGDFLEGALDAVTNLLVLLRLANDVLSLLPSGAASFVAQISVMASLLPQFATAPFRELAQDIGNKLAPATFAAREGFVSMAASLQSATVAAAGLVALQLLLNDLAVSARRAREFSQSINDASDSLREFTDVGEGALDFLRKFEEEGAGVNLGGLERVFDGLQTQDITNELGVGLTQLADLLEVLASQGVANVEDLTDALVRSGTAGADVVRGFAPAADALDPLTEALEAAGVPLSRIEGLSDDARASLLALAKQFALGAEAAFNAAVAEERFTFVGEGLQRRIVDQTRVTGLYVEGLDRLNDANERAARVEFDRIAEAEGVAGSLQRTLIRQNTLEDGTVDYIAVVGDLNEHLALLDDAFLDILDSAPLVAGGFEALTTSGGDARRELLLFAIALEQAGLDAQQLDAIAQRLGSSLTGAELGEQLQAVATDFSDTLAAVEGALPGFGSAFQSAMEQVAIPEEVAEGFDELQFRFDNFTVDAFIEELNKVAEAQTGLLQNLSELAAVDPEIVRRLLELGLDPQQLALVAENLLGSGPQGIENFLAQFTWSEGLMRGLGDDLVSTLVEAGIDPALLAAIPGLTDSATGLVTQGLGAVDVAAAVAPFTDAIERELANFDPNSVLDEANLRRLQGAQARRGGAGGGMPVPTIDREAAVEDARGAAQETSEAFVESMSEFEDEFDGVATDLALGAVSAFADNLDLSLTTAIELAQVGQLLQEDGSIALSAAAAGLRIGQAFTDGMVVAVRNGAPEVIQAIRDMLGSIQLALPRQPAPLTPRFGQFASGLVATRPTAGVFGEAGPEGLIPLTDGRAAARILAQLAPYISSPGREAALELLGVGGPGGAPGGGSVQNNSFQIVAPTDTPEQLARKIAKKLNDTVTG